MKKNLLTLFALSFFLSVGCDKESWKDVALNQNECDNSGEFVVQINDAIGIVKKNSFGYDMLYIELPSNLFPDSQYLTPCNLDIHQVSLNSNIKISGAVYTNLEQELYSVEYYYNPIILSRAQIENKN